MPSDFHKGPNALHPETPSAVGSRNSMNRDGRDEYVEARLLIDEEVDKILNHIESKLPPEVLDDITVQGNIKSYLHTYYNQSLQNMLNRYLTTAEDEMGKKIRDLIDKDEHQTLNRYTPREIAELLNNIGGPELFNTEEVEKSVVNIMGHLQGHAMRGVFEFESATNALLLQRSDVGAFITGQNAYSVVKCTFKDDAKKPEEVSNVRLAVNVLDADLISPIELHGALIEHIVKKVISNHIHSLINKEIEEINEQLSLEGRAELSNEEAIFERMKAIENYTDDDEGENSKRYRLLPKHFVDRLQDLGTQVDRNSPDYDPLSIRDAVGRMLEGSDLRTRGWNTATNSLTAILDTSRMGYQHVENFKHARRMMIREYEETDLNKLPDERYQIELKYLDPKQLREDKAAYSAQLMEFQREIMRLWDVIKKIDLEEKARTNRREWDDVYNENIGSGQGARRGGWFQASSESAIGEEAPMRQWNEITFVQRKLTSLEEMNRTYEEMNDDFKARFHYMRNRLTEIFEKRFPEHRMIIEQRLSFLETEFFRFNAQVNPYHLQPGLLMDLSMTTIKRRKVTVKGMSNVLNEFLLGISKGYTDVDSTAEATHRRSNVSDDIGAFEQQ